MYAEIVILATLMGKAQHGYEIKKHVGQILGGTASLNNKVLYPTLKRFEEMGALRGEVERQEGKPDRHIYQLTERGIEVLQALLRDFTPDIADNNAEFLTRVSFFHLLEPEARLHILATRSSVIAKKLAQIQQMKMLTDETQANPYPRRVLSFHEQRVRHELEWIQTLTEEIQQAKER